jgi:hypothetical protein
MEEPSERKWGNKTRRHYTRRPEVTRLIIVAAGHHFRLPVYQRQYEHGTLPEKEIIMFLTSQGAWVVLAVMAVVLLGQAINCLGLTWPRRARR